MHGDLGNLGKGASHAVGVDQGEVQSGGPGDGEHAVPATDLTCHERGHAPAGQEFQFLLEPRALVAVLDFLDAHRGGANAAARHDERIVGQFVQVDQRNRAVVLGRLQRLEQRQVRIAAAAGAEDRAAAGQGPQRVGGKQSLHDQLLVLAR